MTYEVFSFVPFHKHRSHELIQACKVNNFVSASAMLRENRFLVHDFDFVHILIYDARSCSRPCIGYVNEDIMRQRRCCSRGVPT